MNKISKMYRNREIISQMQEFFEREGFIQISEFFEDELQSIRDGFLKQKFIHEYKPELYSWSVLDEEKCTKFELREFFEFFKSKDFMTYLEEVLGFSLNFVDLRVAKYTWKDFTLLNDRLVNDDYIEMYFDLSDYLNKEDGGTLVYTTRAEEVFYLETAFNTLTCLYKPKEYMKYLKYLNNKTQGKYILRIEARFVLVDEE